MSRLSTSSHQSNAGSLPITEYCNYDFACHHTSPFGCDENITHSPLDAFQDEPHSYKDMLLGFGTHSISESKRKHETAMAKQLAAIAIDKKLGEKGKLKEENLEEEEEQQEGGEKQQQQKGKKRQRSKKNSPSQQTTKKARQAGPAH